MRPACVLLATAAIIPAAAFAGVYKSMEDYLHTNSLEAFAVTHSPGYNGSGGLIQIRICVDATAASRPLVGPLQVALKTWNALAPITGNCGGTNTCVVWEDSSFPDGTTDAMSTLLHELGHCGMGLGHPTLNEWVEAPAAGHTGICDVDNDGCCGERTSFTNSIDAEDATTIFDGVRGDRLNEQTNGCPTSGVVVAVAQKGTCSPPAFPCPVPAECCPDPPPATPIPVQYFHWYRTADNNPVVVDSTVITLTSYRRSPGNLPPGSSFPANGNRLVATALGFPNTQAVMYPLDSRGRVFTGLSADDVNMVKYAMTGADRTAGTSDDYKVAFRYQSSCTGAQIRVRLLDLAGTPPPNGHCRAHVQWSYDQSSEPFVFHWTQIPLSGNAFMELELNTTPSSSTWDFGSHIFSAEDEAGDLREWDGVFP